MKQLEKIVALDNEGALKENIDYINKKKIFELQTIIILVKKYKESLKPESKIQIEQDIFETLDRESKALINEYNANTNPSEMKLKEYRIKSREILIMFIKRLKNEYNNKNPETTVPANYGEWKNKLCELVNIWDLFSSNGLGIRFPFKYLLIKKYFIKRALDKQLISTGEKKEDLQIEKTFLQKILAIFGIGVKDEISALLPRGVISGEGSLKDFMDIMMFCLTTYTFLTMPVLYIMDISLPLLSIIEKFVSLYFFFDLIFLFRTAIKDKANNWVYHIDVIGKNYLSSMFIFDIISSVPFNLFFSSCSKDTNANLKFLRSLIRMIRIGQLFPAIKMAEKIRSITPIIKLLKLICVYLLISHWLAAIIFATIDDSIEYSSMSQVCYFSTSIRNKDTLKASCQWLIGMYNASYLLIGQYTSFFAVYEKLNPTIEYGIFILGYLIGQFMVAFVFGGVANIILNLNQALNFFNKKVDILNNHMTFYNVCDETQNDVRTYYNYLWRSHKDIIYSKEHFNLLTESLREKFELLNLPTNEAYLGMFYRITNNRKMIGQILINLKKKILIPYEILFEEKSVTKGLYILINGQLEMTNVNIPNIPAQSFRINLSNVIEIIEKHRKDKKNKVQDLQPIWMREDLSIVFPLISCLIKTGRNWQRCYTKDFTDLLFLPIKAFDELVFNYPIEMHNLKYSVMKFIDQKKLFDNEILFKTITVHSSKSRGAFYEEKYNKHNLWITIPIPISQRKIAKNYFSSFILKVKKQYREIINSGDFNITLNGFTVTALINKDESNSDIKKDKKTKSKNTQNPEEEDEKETKKVIDPVEEIKDKSKSLMKMIDQVVKC